MKNYSEKIISAFLYERTNKDIANAAGISERTVCRLKNDEKFQKMIKERQKEAINAEISRMTFLFSSCVDELQKIIEDPETKPQIRINAINTLFNQLQNWKQQTELIERMENIEMALNVANCHM